LFFTHWVQASRVPIELSDPHGGQQDDADLRPPATYKKDIYRHEVRTSCDRIVRSFPARMGSDRDKERSRPSPGRELHSSTHYRRRGSHRLRRSVAFSANYARQLKGGDASLSLVFPFVAEPSNSVQSIDSKSIVALAAIFVVPSLTGQ
jgi:hypothetical protein